MTDQEFSEELKRLRSDLVAMRAFLKIPGHLDRLYDLAIKAGGKKPPRTKARSGLPVAFPDQGQIDRAKGFWAVRKRRDLSEDFQHQVEAFRDYHIGRGTLAADWPATWGTWMRNALKFNPVPFRGGQQVNFPQIGETPEVWRWRINAFHKGDPDEQIRPGYWKDAWGPKPGEPGCRAPN